MAKKSEGHGHILQFKLKVPPQRYFLLILLYCMQHVCPSTSDVEHGLMAVASVCSVGGDTAENSSIHLPHTSHLENTLWQKSISGKRGEARVQVRHRKLLQVSETNVCVCVQLSHIVPDDTCIVEYIHYLLSVVLRGSLFLSQVMLASGTPLISHWKRATPPSSTVMDTGWVQNLGRAEEQTIHSALMGKISWTASVSGA